MINPSASNPARFRRRLVGYSSARAAFAAYLSDAKARDRAGVLLPAYLGWTRAEGSGVFDPVAASGLRYEFYRLDENLRIDAEDFERSVASFPESVVLLIHYFGLPDPKSAQLADLARKHGCDVVEDEAHALLSDLVAHQCGEFGEAAVGSLHKLFPVDSGGLLLLPASASWAQEGDDKTAVHRFAEFDLAAIAAARQAIAAFYAETIPTEGLIRPLWSDLRGDFVPQSFPVRVDETIDRNLLHSVLRDRGIGVTSLYYTLIEELRDSRFPDASAVSRSILNLPVHQDMTLDDAELAVRCLSVCAGELVGTSA